MSMNRAFLLATPINHTHNQCHAPCYMAQNDGLLQSLMISEGTKAACAREECALKSSSLSKVSIIFQTFRLNLLRVRCHVPDPHTHVTFPIVFVHS